MLNARKTPIRGPIWGTILMLTALAGCQHLQIDSLPQTDAIASYAASLLAMQGPALQSEYDAALMAFKDTPSPQQQARLGLVRALPGHTGFNPEVASHDLRAALSSAEQTHWTEDERAFLEFQAAILDTLAQHLTALVQAKQKEITTEQALIDARDKLEALSKIERELGK